MTTTPVINITDEQIAEIELEMMRCRFDADEDGPSDPCISYEALSALISSLRAAEKDRDRLDFISGNWFENCAFFPSRIEFAYNEQWYEEGSNLREAIDAAMEQSK